MKNIKKEMLMTLSLILFLTSGCGTYFSAKDMPEVTSMGNQLTPSQAQATLQTILTKYQEKHMVYSVTEVGMKKEMKEHMEDNVVNWISPSVATPQGTVSGMKGSYVQTLKIKGWTQQVNFADIHRVQYFLHVAPNANSANGKGINFYGVKNNKIIFSVTMLDNEGGTVTPEFLEFLSALYRLCPALRNS